MTSGVVLKIEIVKFSSIRIFIFTSVGFLFTMTTLIEVHHQTGKYFLKDPVDFLIPFTFYWFSEKSTLSFGILAQK